MMEYFHATTVVALLLICASGVRSEKGKTDTFFWL